MLPTLRTIRNRDQGQPQNYPPNSSVGKHGSLNIDIKIVAGMTVGTLFMIKHMPGMTGNGPEC